MLKRSSARLDHVGGLGCRNLSRVVASTFASGSVTVAVVKNRSCERHPEVLVR